MWRSIYIAATLTTLVLFVLAGCSSGTSGSNGAKGGNSSAAGNAQTQKAPTGPKTATGATNRTTSGNTMGSSTEKAQSQTGFPKVAAGTKSVPAFTGLSKADSAAKGWEKDAKLYAIASVVPKVDAEGRGPAWLYTYISASADAVKSIMVDGGKVKSLQDQSVPQQSVDLLEQKALPSSGKLIDSPEAMKKSNRVRGFLKKNPGAKSSAGLDSTSTPKPVWILATVKGDQRIEERIPATSGGS